MRDRKIKQNRSSSSGEELEREVERLYALLGATVRRRILIKGYEIDVHAIFSRGPIRFAVIVECKERAISHAVSDIDMRSFVVKLLAARECGAADKGVFVTTSHLAKTALATAELHGIQCLRLSELYNQLADFSGYLNAIITDFKNSTLSQWYVEQTASEIEDYDTLTAVDRASALHSDVVKCVDDILFVQKENRVAVLGNFGTGKTSFCLKYRDLLASRATSDVSARIPILVDLREFRSGLDIHQVERH
jgi:restriction endonuclease